MREVSEGKLKAHAYGGENGRIERGEWERKGGLGFLEKIAPFLTGIGEGMVCPGAETY